MWSASVFRKVGVFCLLFLGLEVGAEPGWLVQRPMPQGRDLWAVKMLDANTILAAGGGGTILRSTDAGSSWTVNRPFESSVQLSALWFVDDTVGTVVGSNGTIARTVDGGLSWSAEESGATDDLKAVSFAGADVGTAVGAHGTILRTTDGGASWVRQESGIPTTLIGVWMVDPEHAIAVGWDGYPEGRQGRVLRTTDGGQAWSLQSYPFFHVGDVTFFDGQHGIIVGSDDRFSTALIQRTADGGETWRTDRPSGLPYLSRVTIAGPRSAMALSGGGGARTDDLGETWQWHYFDWGTSISFADENIATLIGRRGLISRSEDGGEHWMLQSSRTDTLFGVSMVNPATATVVAPQIILRTEDGGETWRQQERPRCCEAGSAVFFTDPDRGFAAGTDLFRTIDGGETWTVLFPGPGPFVALSFLDGQRGWLASLHRIQRTQDGGDSFVTQWSGDYFLHGIAFADENRGVAVGSSGSPFSGGVVLRTSDGGANWAPEVMSEVPLLSGVSFSGDIGTAVGWFGVILRSVDAGQTWERQESGTERDLFAVWQSDENIATAVGTYATILRTVDGGKSWYLQPADVNPDQGLLAVSFADPDNGMVVGDGGLILRTWSGGEETAGGRQTAR